MRWLFALLALVFSVSPARAQWFEVSSDHFLIYGDQSETQLLEFAQRLEMLHAAMVLRHKVELEKPSPSNRVVIYSVGSTTQVRKLADMKGSSVAGIYIPRAGATMAIVPRIRRASNVYDLSGETVLYHEYAHHFFNMITTRDFPRWLSEGYAEFYSSVKFEKDTVLLGAPAGHRAAEMAYAFKVPIRDLLSADGAWSTTGGEESSFYGQSWLLFHYLMFNKARAAQLGTYQELLAAGKPALEAAESAFGDLKALDEEVGIYAGKQRLTALGYLRSVLNTGPIRSRKISPSHEAIMPVLIQSRRGVDEEQAKRVVAEARNVAARFPDDPFVLAGLAEAELDAENPDAAIAAADRAIALDSNRIEAHIQKGHAMFAKAKTASAPDWKAVRTQYAKANRIEPDNPIPLIRYYTSFGQQGVSPPKIAVDGLARAAQLAPFDMGLKGDLAMQWRRDGLLDQALELLAPIANNPHQNESSDWARQQIEEIHAEMKAGKSSGQGAAKEASSRP